ncbi:sensor histidine kinase [Kineosporia sp. R_H_3]|uniref:sensor histidine kinase n=1 Tax=Kineosporia sp. R_H_3 TaxID=1961848 RepID=UPI000B4BED88|nr:histidine kinase [Kineosporia sp. R_H_3]
MPAPSVALRERLTRFFALDDDWERPGALDGWDVVVGLGTLLFSAVTFELMRSAGLTESVTAPGWVQWAAVVGGAAILVWRRRRPLTVLVLAAVHMFVVGVTMPEVMGQLSMQVVYFCAIFSGVAWARSRREMLVVVTLVVTFMFAWLAWGFAFGSGVDDIVEALEEDATKQFGLVSPVAAAVLITTLVNVVYFGGAVLVGQVSWRSARQRARLAEQAALLETQGETLRRRAVLEERLRIARELHDVVAHHVSVIGIHAAAGRRVIGRDVEAAGRALGQVEESSREAVSQMRGLLGTLRSADEPDDGATTGTDGRRAPEPGLTDLAELVTTFDGDGLTASYRLVEEPVGASARVPAPVALSIYRTTQEALANVRRHSTAQTANVVVRVAEAGAGGGHVEVEVTDDGRPRAGTSGSGLGQLGIRERVASHRGQAEIGPRVTGGYRVRVRLPLSFADGGPRTTPDAVPAQARS